MPRLNRSVTTIFAVITVAAFCLLNYHLVQSNPTADKNSREYNDFMVPFEGVECQSDEMTVHGKHPMCEPTCDNPRPVCTREFYYDSVLCFCKPPQVRNSMKKCVPLNKCD